MYLTLADLNEASAAILPDDLYGPSDVPGTGYQFNLVSDSSGSLINPAVYNPGKEIFIVSEIRIEGQPLVFQIPFQSMMISFKTLYDRYKTAEANFLSRSNLLRVDPENPMQRAATWAPGYPVNLGGAMNFHGWAIAQDPHTMYAKYPVSPPEKTDKSGLQGDVEMKLNGKVLGTLHYFWGNIPFVKRATTMDLGGTFGFGSDPDQVNMMNNVPNAPPQQRSITGDSAGWHIPMDYRKTRFGRSGLWEFQDIFKDAYFNVKLNGGLTGTPQIAVTSSFSYNPWLKQQMTDYYNETSERVSV